MASRRPSRAERAAIQVARIGAMGIVASALVSGGLAVGNELLKPDALPPVPCYQIFDGYEKTAEASTEKRAVILGESGTSPLLTDPYALRCGITVDQVRRALPPVKPAVITQPP